MRSKLWACALVAGFCIATPRVFALDILLTNDDGYQADGINIMFATLTAAGHNVTMVAPRQNQSGKGMSVNTQVFQPAIAEEFADAKWFLEGTPVDCVQFGLDVVFADSPPDLVVSGTNHGINPGVGVGTSGTVGAAQNALLRGIPALAVSAGENPGDEESIKLALDDAAEFTVQVIAQINNNGVIQLPPGIGLNINYPARNAADTAGVVVTTLSETAVIPFTYKRMKDGSLVAIVQRYSTDVSEQEKGTDWHMIREGYVTVTPIDPNINASESVQRRIESLLGDNLQP